jgi:WD40 repeat protein
VLAGHGAMVLGLSFDTDGRHLFTSSMDRAVRRWEARGAGGAPERPVGHGSMVVGIAISPDGRQAASGGEDATIRLWDVATGQQLRVLRGHGAKVFGLSFSPDGKTLASGSTDRSLRLWDVASGEERKVLLGHTDKVFDVHFRSDGNLLASAGADATVRLWAMPEGEQRQILSGHRGAVHGVRFSPDGRLLASSGNDGVVKIWDGASGRALRTLKEHTSEAWGVDFASDGKTLACGRTDGTVDLWETASWTGRTVGRQDGRVYWVAVHPVDGRIGAPGSADVRLWTPQGRSIPFIGHRAEVNWLRFSSDGELAATSSDDGTVRLWEIGQDRVRPRWRAPALLREPDGGVWLYSHRGQQRLDDRGAPQGRESRWRRAILTRARRAALSPDGGLLCLVTLDGKLEIWDPGQDRSIASQSLPGLREVIALPAGCLTLDGQAVRLTARDGRSRVLVDSEARAVSRDAQGLLVAAGERVQLFTDSGQPRATPPLETDVGVTALTRAPPWLVLGYRDGNVELLALESGKRRTNFSLEEVPASPVERMLVGPMDTLVVGFAGGQLGLWDLTTGRRLHHTRLHGPVIHLHRLAHHGRLYAASELGSHQIWDLAALRMPYCELLREVWRQVSVVWEQGRPVARRPPADHPCRRR